MTGIAYEDFVDRDYEPAADELVCRFYVEPGSGLEATDAAGRIASESSNGTWAELDVEGSAAALSATAFEVREATAGRGDGRGRGGADRDGPDRDGPDGPGTDRDGYEVVVAYPDALFDAGNMPQVLSCVAGNVLGMKAVDRLRLRDCEWPEPLATAFPGPGFGSSVREAFFDAGDRPLTATVPKPKVGLSAEEHAAVGYEAWTGGIDLLKDDENLTDQAFDPFADRLAACLDARDRAEAETGEPKAHLVNVTADATTMLDRVDDVADAGGEYVMVDVVTAGWAGVQAVRERCGERGLAIHAHRAMHAAFDRPPAHGVSMRVLAQVARLCGVDQIHTGTANLGKMANEDTLGINDWLRSDLYGHGDVLPVASGGLHPGLMPALIDELGTTVCVQAGGGVHGHPDGTHAGATALRAAVDAAVAGEDLDARAEAVPELRTALDRWGTETPR